MKQQKTHITPKGLALIEFLDSLVNEGVIEESCQAPAANAFLRLWPEHERTGRPMRDLFSDHFATVEGKVLPVTEA